MPGREVIQASGTFLASDTCASPTSCTSSSSRYGMDVCRCLQEAEQPEYFLRALGEEFDDVRVFHNGNTALRCSKSCFGSDVAVVVAVASVIVAAVVVVVVVAADMVVAVTVVGVVAVGVDVVGGRGAAAITATCVVAVAVVVVFAFMNGCCWRC